MKNICQACFLTHFHIINLQCKLTWGWVTKVFVLVQRGGAEKVCVAESCQSSFSCSERWFSQLFGSEILRITSGPQNAWLEAGGLRAAIQRCGHMNRRLYVVMSTALLADLALLVIHSHFHSGDGAGRRRTEKTRRMTWQRGEFSLMSGAAWICSAGHNKAER